MHAIPVKREKIFAACIFRVDVATVPVKVLINAIAETPGTYALTGCSHSFRKWIGRSASVVADEATKIMMALIVTA